MDLHLAVAVSMLAVSRCRASATFKELRQQNPSVQIADLLEAMRIPPEARRRLEDAAQAAATKSIAAGVDAGMDPIPWFDSRYSALLNCVADPPPVLWVRGIAAVLAMPTVAIVGSRAATPYALDVGARLAGELSARGVAVASGLARGVDSAAHRGTLAAGGSTIAVLGSGLDRIYPPEHGTLAQTITDKGLIVSELGAGAPPLAEHFPLRNRIISGISLAVVVVEASENSGSLITARCATDQGRDVMAVPGSVLTGRNRGSHGLLKDGAKVVETADDILEELGWPAARMAIEDPRKLLPHDPLLTHMEAGEVYGLDELVDATGTPPSKLLPRLMELELQGLVKGAGGGRFMRSGGSAKGPTGQGFA
ncbi:MAG: DNA-processing protein DprA [Acidobacteriota bacterium]|nr:DNA-processing protein DprA [Acidobacteriota bacterium]